MYEEGATRADWRAKENGSMTSRVLVIDDDRDAAELLRVQLADTHQVTVVTSYSQAIEALGDQDFAAVITDVRLGDESGLAICQWVVENRPDTPVVVITAFGNMETAIGAIRAGAYDFITKPIDQELLGFTLRRALQHRELSEQVKRLRSSQAEVGPLPGMIGDSPPMRRLSDLVTRAAQSDATTLITGESGTGKELVALAVHNLSERRNGPFVALNCAAIPENLLEREMFGNETWSFSVARSTRQGVLRQANGGTLFLDEIAETPKDMQVKLLRALQERKARPVGGDQELDFDVRIVAATNRDIETEVEEGRFREDLYYRLNVVRVRVPSLRSRGKDVLLLAQWFLERIAQRRGSEVKGLAPATAERLLDYDWPGNVRELENAIERAMALARFDQVLVEDLPERIRKYESSHVVVASSDPEELLSLEEVERRYVYRVLAATGGNKTQAAQILGLDRRTLYRKLERYEQNESADSGD
jgi:two-component system response regulator AtoC